MQAHAVASKILVVEDEGIIADDLQATLRRLGYEVPLTSATGTDAIAAVESFGHDLVLMDIHLRGEMDGVEAAEVIRQRFGTPIVYLTSYSDDETFARVQRTEPYACLLKPFDERSLRNTIELTLQRRNLQRRIEERENWFSTTLQCIGDAVVATDANERVTFLNGAAEKVTGWERADALGLRVDEVLHFVDPRGQDLPSPIHQALERRQVVDLPAQAALSVKGGGTVGVDDRAAPIIDGAGTVLGGVVVLRDVTERRRLEERVVLTERLAALGTLAAGLGHEINNPLTYVLANLTFCIDSVERTLASAHAAPVRPDLLEALREARDGGDRVKGVVERLRAFVRSEVLPRRPASLEALVREAVTQTRHQLQHVARVHLSAEKAPEVDVVAGELVQVLTNLLVNAGHAVADRGRGEGVIEVRVGTAPDGRPFVTVEDDGVGIDPAHLHRVFEPFFTTKPAGLGSGIGLSLSHAIVRDHGGDLTLESTLGVGTKVIVTLPPLAHQDAEPPSSPSSRRAEKSVRRRILVIDDEPSIGRSIRRVLVRDHDVDLIGVPADALQALLDGADYDVIFCDLMMPGMSGITLYERLRDARPKLAGRLVFLTGGAFTPQAVEFLRDTTVPTLTKPFKMDALRALVTQITERD